MRVFLIVCGIALAAAPAWALMPKSVAQKNDRVSSHAYRSKAQKRALARDQR